MSDNLIEVLVPIPLLEKFSYLLPKHIKSSLPLPGSRVMVPFGRRTLVGIVWKKNSSPNLKIKKYKYIKEVIDNEPLLTKDLLDLADWASRYYHHPLGEVISYFFPPSLRKGKDAKFLETSFWDLTNKGEFFQMEDLSRAPNQQKALEIFTQRQDKTPLEKIEDLELLRFIEIGEKIKMISLSDTAISVDNPKDILKVENKLNNK